MLYIYYLHMKLFKTDNFREMKKMNVFFFYINDDHIRHVCESMLDIYVNTQLCQ